VQTVKKGQITLKMKKILSALLASAVAMSLVAGCGGEKKEDAKASDVIKVGVFLPLTGDNAAGGELELRGIKLANKLHPEVLGKKIELVVADNKSDKAEAASVAARLIEKDKVSVIVGSYGSSLSMAAGNIVKDSKVPAVGTSCTNPQVTANNDYYFRACFIDPFQGTVMANYAFKQGAKKVAIVQEVSNDYAVGLAKFFKEAFIKLTGDENSIVEIANYQTGDKDFSAILTNIKAKNPDAIFAPGNFTESALLVKQARQLGIEAPFMGGDTWETQEFIDVFETAVRMYPKDEIASINAAAAALSRNDLVSAERYLNMVNVNKQLPEYSNAMGVLMLLKGEYEHAEEYLKAAAKSGLQAAGQNLEELAKKKTNAAEIEKIENRDK
jgi:branched-chain amino acid transport system substrate-binding protein